MNNLPKCPECKRTKNLQVCCNCTAKLLKEARQDERKKVFNAFYKRLHWFENIVIFKKGKPIYYDIDKDVIEKVFNKLESPLEDSLRSGEKQ